MAGEEDEVHQRDIELSAQGAPTSYSNKSYASAGLGFVRIVFGDQYGAYPIMRQGYLMSEHDAEWLALTILNQIDLMRVREGRAPPPVVPPPNPPKSA